MAGWTVSWLDASLARWADGAEELRLLDAAVGDGDLGITVSRGVAAIREKLSRLEADPEPAALSRTVGAAFAKANPSTMAALIGGGLLAASRSVSSASSYDRATLARMLTAVIDSIKTRGHSTPGEKTVLDGLVASLVPLESCDGDGRAVLSAMVEAADTSIAAAASKQAVHGRASWLGERSAGHRDPGAVAYLLLLQAMLDMWPDHVADA